MSWSTSELRVRLAPLNQFKPPSKIFYWPFQVGTSFVDLLCFCSVLCLLCLCARLFICALWSPAGKGLTSWLSFVVSTVSLSLSHWYPGSGVVLDCINFWSLHPYFLLVVTPGTWIRRTNMNQKNFISFHHYIHRHIYLKFQSFDGHVVNLCHTLKPI